MHGQEFSWMSLVYYLLQCVQQEYSCQYCKAASIWMVLEPGARRLLGPQTATLAFLSVFLTSWPFLIAWSAAVLSSCMFFISQWYRRFSSHQQELQWQTQQVERAGCRARCAGQPSRAGTPPGLCAESQSIECHARPRSHVPPVALWWWHKAFS